MNERPGFLKAIGPASLADEEDFQLGDLVVQPSLREVRSGDAREIIEPRVMQVFVALARANGAVVSRDDLIRQCWGGRIVGEDAINRCVSKVRQLSELGGSKAFEIETIARVGYRLMPTRPAGDVPCVPASSHLRPASRLEPAFPDEMTRRAQPRRWPHSRIGLVASATLLLAAIATGALLLWPRPMKHWEVVESHQPFISTPDVERFPSFSPDGTMIAYSRGKEASNRQIFLQLRRGGDPIQLTHDQTDDVAPAFSPDGTAVAYFASQEKEPCRIMLAQVPAGPTRQIGRCRSVAASMLSWDRSGHAIFYDDRYSASEFPHILRYDIDTGALTDVTRSGAGGSLADFQPSVAPDGATILFMRYVKGERLQVILRDLRSGKEGILADGTADKYAVWSNDSKTVFVTQNQGSDSSLWAYPASGAEPQRITSNSRLMEFLSTGPDGLLAVELKNKVSQLSVATYAQGDTPRALDTNGFAGCSFEYAPDGTLALVTNNGESPIIVVGKPGHLHEILRLKEHIPCGIHWSPDGARLAFGGGDAGSMISIITRAGVPVGQVPYPTEDFGYFEWAADGRAFLQMRREARGWRVWRVDLAPPYRAKPMLPYGWNWVRQHAGMTFGTKDGSAGIWRIDQTPKRLTDWPSAERPWLWTIVGDKLVYPDFSDPQHPLIVAQPTAGGARTIIGYADGMDAISFFAVDPQSGQATYNRVVRDDPDIGWLRLEQR